LFFYALNVITSGVGYAMDNIYGLYNQGKCKGYQFFKPQDEYDIKLAFEGKIQLNESQIQPNINDNRIGEFHQEISCKKKFLILFLYIIFGHILYYFAASLYFFKEDNGRPFRRCGDCRYLIIAFALFPYFILEIVFFLFHFL